MSLRRLVFPATIFFGLAAFAQVATMALGVHIVNPFLDRLLWYTFGFNVLFPLTLLGINFGVAIKSTFLKMAVLIPTGLVGFLATGLFLYGLVHVSESNLETRFRMQFFADSRWTYYANTTRRSALDDLDIYCYKEENIAPGLLRRVTLSERDLIPLAINPDTLRNSYGQFYRAQRK